MMTIPPVFHIPLQRASFLTAGVVMLLASGGMAQGATQFKAINPTVFLVNGDHGLKQKISLVLSVAAPLTAAVVTVKAGADVTRCELGDLAAGEQERDILIPDIRRKIPVRFELLASGQTLQERVIDWQPTRHWEIYAVHGSHHDLGYTDIPSNVLREHSENLDRVLDYCDQTDDWPEDSRFHYTVEQAWSISHYASTQPEAQLNRLQRRLQEGRIEITALFGNEITELCGSEEQIRHVYPAFHLARRFGAPVTSAELNDIPGASWGLVTVLAGSGVRYFSGGIPDYYGWGGRIHAWWDEAAVLPRDVPGAFWWEGFDGSRVLYWHTGDGIDGPLLWDYAQVKRDLPGHLNRITERGYPFDVLRAKFHGAFRDNAPPNLRLSEVVREWNTRWAYPHLRVATNRRFFEELERRAGDELKVVRGDLPGTDYSIGAASSARETGVNRRTHDALPAAEAFATWAALLGVQPYPARALTEAWEDTLLFDEHTWGMGHPVGPAQDANWAEKSVHAWRAAGVAQDILVRSTQRIAEQIDLPVEGQFIVVFNALGQTRSDVVRLAGATLTPATATPVGMVGLPRGYLDQPLQLVDVATGERVPHQVITLHGPDDARPWAADRWALSRISQRSLDVLNYDQRQAQELVFVATDVPALGYKTYRLLPDKTDAPLPHTGPVRVADNTLENEFYRVTLDPVTGAVASLFDKTLNREWRDLDCGYQLNQVLVREPGTGTVHPAERATLHPGEQGPVMGSLIVRGDALGCPQLTQEITLYAGLRRIDFATRLLKDATPNLEYFLAYPFALTRPRFAFSAPNTYIRPIQDQMPGSSTDTYSVEHWVGAWDNAGGVTLASLEAPLFKFSQLWPTSVSQAHHGVTPLGFGAEFLRDPAQFTNGHLYSYALVSNFRTNFRPTQPGEVLFRYSLTTHDGALDRVRAGEFGAASATPLLPFPVAGPRKGPLPTTKQFCAITPPGALQSLKQAEDGRGIVVRLREVSGTNTEASVSFPDLTVLQARSANLVEQPVCDLNHDGRSVRVPLKADTLATVRIEVAR